MVGLRFRVTKGTRTEAARDGGYRPLVAGKRQVVREPMPYAEFRALADQWRTKFVEVHQQARGQGMSLAHADKYAKALAGPVPSLYR